MNTQLVSLVAYDNVCSYNRIWSKIEGQLDRKGFLTVVRIFEWIAFGERPLKKHEIQDGVTLDCEHSILNEETRISRSVFNLCKPLLEDGVYDTVRFIHSSVKEYFIRFIRQCDF